MHLLLDISNKCKTKREEVHKMNESLGKSINSSTMISIIAIIAMAICCLSAMRYNAKISIEKEKIEVATNSNSNLTS